MCYLLNHCMFFMSLCIELKTDQALIDSCLNKRSPFFTFNQSSRHLPEFKFPTDLIRCGHCIRINKQVLIFIPQTNATNYSSISAIIFVAVFGLEYISVRVNSSKFINEVNSTWLGCWSSSQFVWFENWIDISISK